MTALHLAGVEVRHGDALELLAGLPAESVDAVITDPPYGVSIMGRAWDGPAGMLGHHATGRGARPAGGLAYGGAHSRGLADHNGKAYQAWCELWAAECLRLLRPGGHLVAFGATRTGHRLGCAVEDAGFEIRDALAWLYAQGMPKGKRWGDGLGTTLAPSYEPVTVARKPFAGTVVANVERHGTGALNVEACRTPVQDPGYATNASGDRGHDGTRAPDERGATTLRTGGGSASALGRFPTNVLLDEHAAAALDEQSGIRPGMRPGLLRRGATTGRGLGSPTTFEGGAGTPHEVVTGYADTGGASRFYPVFRYQAKAPKAERPEVGGVKHETVKPLALMRWLVRLFAPPGGHVLDPFAGSGTTGEACALEGRTALLVEQGAEYLPLIAHRLARVGGPHAQEATP